MTQPFVPAPNTLQVEMVYSTNGGIAENVYHVNWVGTLTDLTGLSGALDTAFAGWETSHGAAARSSQVKLTKIRVRDIRTVGGAVYEYSHAIAGTDVALAAPDNVTVAIKWQTARGGRSYRGRTYHVGLPNDSILGDQLGTAAAANFPTVYNFLLTAVSGVNYAPYGPSAGFLAVVSKRQAKAWLTTAVVTPINSATLADTNLDSMRRRLKGRGA